MKESIIKQRRQNIIHSISIWTNRWISTQKLIKSLISLKTKVSEAHKVVKSEEFITITSTTQELSCKEK